MSINLLEIAESTLGPILLSKAGDLFGLNHNDGSNALKSILPTLLSGILNKASTNQGAAALYKAVTDSSVDSNIGKTLTNQLNDPSIVSKLGTQGGQILGFLFGDKATGLGEQVAHLAGTPSKGTSGLLALAAPAIFGLLKNHIVGNKLSPHGFTSLLSSQAPHLESSLSEKVLEWLGWGSIGGFIGGLGSKFSGALGGLSNLFDDGTPSPNSSNNNNKGGGLWKWLLPLALLALAGLLFKSCSKTEEAKPAPAAPAPAAVVTPAPAPAAAPAPTAPEKVDPAAAMAAAGANFADAIKALDAGKCDADALSKALGLYIVNFASGSAAIPAKDVTALKTAAPATIACAKAGVKIEVGGHTDNTGNAAANVKLSQARANAIKALFVGAGVPAANISTKGYGDTTPVGDNATEAGRFQNRRITYTKQ